MVIESQSSCGLSWEWRLLFFKLVAGVLPNRSGLIRRRITVGRSGKKSGRLTWLAWRSLVMVYFLHHTEDAACGICRYVMSVKHFLM